MNPTPEPAKTRSDCILDSQLDPVAAETLSDRLDRGLSLHQAVQFLQTEHGITISESSVSRWAAKCRKAKSEMAFACLREQLAIDHDQALELADEEKAVESLNTANTLLAARALFAAQRSGDPTLIAHATRIFSSVMGAVTKARKLEVATADAATREAQRADSALFHAVLLGRKQEANLDRQQEKANLKREIFDFDVEATSRKHREALDMINATGDISQRERISRAIHVIFARQPLSTYPGAKAKDAAPPADSTAPAHSTAAAAG